MQKTGIFISSAAESLKHDITETETFILRLNNCYIDRGLYFTPIAEATAFGATAGSPASMSQNSGAASLALADCELAFFLAESDGGGLPDAYKSALDSYNKTGKPRIFTYVKSQGLGFRDQGSVDGGHEGKSHGSGTRGQGLLDSGSARLSDGSGLPISINSTPRRNGAFHTQLSARSYTHIDTVKLGILMQIKQLGLNGVDIRLEGGKAWQGDAALLALDNVEAISGYENLQNLKHNREAIESRYVEAKARCAENPGDQEAYEAFVKASGQRLDAISEIRDIEAQLYHIMEGMYVQTSQGKLSQRQAEAYNLVERGLLSEARDVLDFYSIVGENRHREDVADRYVKEAQISVSELLQLKDINAALLDWDSVDECYKEAARLEEKYDLPRNASVLYTEHLYYQNRHDEAIEIGGNILQYFRRAKANAADDEKSFLYNMLGIIFSTTNRMREAEDMLKASLEIRLASKDRGSDDAEKDIAIVYNGLGNLYYLSKRYDEAVDAHKHALGIRKRLAENNPESYEEYLAYTYVNIGAVYSEMGKHEEAVELKVAALDIFRRLASGKPEKYDDYLSLCFKNLCNSFVDLKCYDEAEEQLNYAYDIELKLAGNNPRAYEHRLGETYSKYANIFLQAKRYRESEDKYDAAISTYRKAAAANPDAFEPQLAKCYTGIAELFTKTQRFADAETALNLAIKLFDRHAEANPANEECAAEARKALAKLNAKQLRDGEGAIELTPQEQEIALLLTDGISKGEIARKLHLSAGDVDRITKAIREKVVSKEAYDPVIDEIAKAFKLTGRETDMLRCMSLDMGNSDIANDLILSDETVRKHTRSLMRKLPVDRRQDVAAWLNSYYHTASQT